MGEIRDPNRPYSPMASAIEWVSRITVVSLLMFLPGVLGRKLDEWLGTGFFSLIGFGLGLVAGLGLLLVMTKAVGRGQTKRNNGQDRGQDRGQDCGKDSGG